MWSCICDCGNKTTVYAGHLKSGHTTSCGCHRAETMSDLFSTHRMAGTPLYRMWHNMRTRCNYSKSDHYFSYGERGIVVCDEWEHSFEAFYEWAIQNGYKDGLSIERKDVNGNYTPENCCFIQLADQAMNKQNTRYVEFSGELRPAVLVAKEIGIAPCTFETRLRKGWTDREAIETPLHGRRLANCG